MARRLSLLLAMVGIAGCGGYEGMTEAEIGLEVYKSQCSICHQANGGGVPDLQPPLAGSSLVLGDPATLIEVITQGSTAPSLRDRESFGNAMAGFDHLSDLELTAVTNYIRAQFGNQASELTEAQVAELRQR